MGVHRKILERRACQVRVLLESGLFRGVPIFTRDGRILPAELLAGMALADMDRLKKRAPDLSRADVVAWQRLIEDIELLHEVANPRDDECVPE
jgi:hypothetical protein